MLKPCKKCGSTTAPAIVDNMPIHATAYQRRGAMYYVVCAVGLGGCGNHREWFYVKDAAEADWNGEVG